MLNTSLRRPLNNTLYASHTIRTYMTSPHWKCHKTPLSYDTTGNNHVVKRHQVVVLYYAHDDSLNGNFVYMSDVTHWLCQFPKVNRKTFGFSFVFHVYTCVRHVYTLAHLYVGCERKRLSNMLVFKHCDSLVYVLVSNERAFCLAHTNREIVVHHIIKSYMYILMPTWELMTRQRIYKGRKNI